MTSQIIYAESVKDPEKFDQLFLPPVGDSASSTQTPSIASWLETMKRKTGRDMTQSSPNLDPPPRWKLFLGVLRPLIEEYVSFAISRSTIEQLADETYYAAVPEIPGVWADSASPQSAREELAEVIREWLELKIEDEDYDIPSLNGLDLNANLRYLLSAPSQP